MFEIGNSLREARLRKELDFPELEQGTKIRAKYLRALEDETFDQLPGPTYVKGFLRTYADYLALDGQLYVDEYNVRYGTGEETMDRRPRSTPAPRPRPRRGRRRKKFESSVVWFTLVAIAVVTALVIAAWRFGGGTNQQLPLSSPAKVPHRAAGLIVRAVQGDTLLIVRSGSETGKQIYQGTLLKGTAQRFGTAKGLWVYLGSPEHVRMILHGSDVPVGGGQPRSLIVPAGSS